MANGNITKARLNGSKQNAKETQKENKKNGNRG
jgi:hypothetical protein